MMIALLNYLFAQEFKRIQEGMETEQQESVTSQLLALSSRFVATMQRMAKLMPQTFEIYVLSGRNREVHQLLKDCYRDYRQELLSLIQRGIERGEFDAVDPEKTATTLAALYEGLAFFYFGDLEVREWAEQAEMSTRLLLAGIQRYASASAGSDHHQYTPEKLSSL